jgi:hypothetical protein
MDVHVRYPRCEIVGKVAAFVILVLGVYGAGLRGFGTESLSDDQSRLDSTSRGLLRLPSTSALLTCYTRRLSADKTIGAPQYLAEKTYVAVRDMSRAADAMQQVMDDGHLLYLATVIYDAYLDYLSRGGMLAHQMVLFTTIVRPQSETAIHLALRACACDTALTSDVCWASELQN